jgi:hypothetical protein
MMVEYSNEFVNNRVAIVVEQIAILMLLLNQCTTIIYSHIEIFLVVMTKTKNKKKKEHWDVVVVVVDDDDDDNHKHNVY